MNTGRRNWVVVTALVASVASGVATAADKPAAPKKKTTTAPATTAPPAAKKESTVAPAPVKQPPPAPEEEVVAVKPQATSAPAGDSAVDDLLRILDEESAIATKTKLNIDFVPGMVTVLHGRDLLAKGIHTVYEALSLVPGMELSMSSEGQPQFLVRGLGKTFASTKIKFLLNGIDTNTALGPQIVVHGMPIEQIDRIEVIRGPGSAIYGEYALAGVVDIKTLEDSKRVHARYGDVEGYRLGGTYADEPKDARYGWSISVAKGATDGGNVHAGKDKLWNNAQTQTLSNSPGRSNERQENQDLIFKFHYDEIRLTAQHLKVGFGDHFGVNDILPDDSDRVVRISTVNSAQVTAPWVLKNDIKVLFGLDWMNFVGEVDAQLIFPGYGSLFAGTGALGGPHYEETRTALRAGFDVPAMNHHKWIGGIEAVVIEQGDTWNKRNFDPDLLGPPPQAGEQVPYQEYTGDENWLEEDLTRRILSAYAQDQYDGFGAVTITAGARADHYSDVGDAFSPRLAAVYQVSNEQTLKVQYSDSFRPPSFLELYSKNNPIVNGNPDIKPERMHTYELGYIFNNGSRVFRITSFVSELHDVIVVNSTTDRYENGGTANFRGLELEYVVPLQQRVKLDGNVSLLDSESDDVVNSNWGTAQVLGNLGVLYQLATDRFVNAQYRYVGPRTRSADDTRSDLDAYQVVDVSVSLARLWVPALTLRAGIKNMFDADVRYPAPVNTYQDDYPRPGRQWWLSADYSI